MIGVYAGVSVKPEHVEEFLKTIEPLVTASRQDEGNVSYDFGAVSDTDFAFIERWESQELLEKHMGTEHFQKAVAAWEPLLSSELDVRQLAARLAFILGLAALSVYRRSTPTSTESSVKPFVALTQCTLPLFTDLQV